MRGVHEYNRSRVTWFASVLGLMALIAAGCSSTPASSNNTTSSSSPSASTSPPTTASFHSVVTPAMVPSLLATYSRKNNAANTKLSVAMQNTDEEGFAAAVDDESFREDRAAGFATIDGSKYYPFTFSEISADVAIQTKYPAVFAVLARAQNSAGTPSSDRSHCPGLGNLFVFAKDSASAPWRVALEPAVKLAAVPAFVTGAQGFGAFAGSAQTFRVPLSNVGTTYAVALENYARTGAFTSGLTPSMFTGSCAILPDLRSTEHAYAGHGLHAAFSFSFAPVALITQEAWQVKGGALVAVDINGTETLTAPSGHTVVVSHVAGQPGTYEIASGTYVSVSFPIDVELVVFDPLSTSATGAVPVGSSMGFLAGTGVR